MSSGDSSKSVTGEELAEDLFGRDTSVTPDPSTMRVEAEATSSIEERFDTFESDMSLVQMELAAIRFQMAELLDIMQQLLEASGSLEAKRESIFTMLASEAVLRREWDTPEEDEAWSDL